MASGAPALKKMLEGGAETETASAGIEPSETEASEADNSEVDASEVGPSDANASDVDTSEVDASEADTTHLDEDTGNVEAVNGHSEEEEVEEVDESKEKLVAETVIETITLEESNGLVTTTTTTTIVSKVEEQQGGMVCADSLDSVRRSMDSLNICNTPDSLGGEEELRTTQEQLEEVLEKAATIQSQVLESIVGVESGEVVNAEDFVKEEKVEEEMMEEEEKEEVRRNEAVEVEVAVLSVEQDVVEDLSQNRGIVGLKEVLEKPESNEQTIIPEKEPGSSVEHEAEKKGIEGIKEALETPIKPVEENVEFVGEIDDDSDAVKPTPAEIIDINGNTGGVMEKSEDEIKNGVKQAEEEHGEEDISASTASGEEESTIEEQGVVEVVEDVTTIHVTETSVSNPDSTKQLNTLQATETVQKAESTQETEIVEETIQCLEEETEALVALEVAVSGESSFLEAKSSVLVENSSSMETNSITLEVNSYSTESGSSFSAANSSSLETKTSSIEAKSSSMEAESSSMEANSSSLEANSSSMEAKSSSMEANSSSLEEKSSSMEAQSSSIEAQSSSSQMIMNLSPAPLAHTLPRQKKSGSPARSTASPARSTVSPSRSSTGKNSVRKLSPTQTLIGGKVIEMNSDKAQYLHLSMDQIQELALAQQRGTLFSGGAGGGGGEGVQDKENGVEDHEHEHHCALRQAGADKRTPVRRSSMKKPVPGVKRNTLQAPDIIKEAVAHSNGHSESNGVRNGRSSSASRHSHPSPTRSSRGPTPEVRRSSNSKGRIREKTLEKEDMLGTSKTTEEEEVVVVRMKKFSNSEAQQRSVNRLSGIVSRGRSQGETVEGESRMSKSWLKSRSPSPSLAFGSTSPRKVVRSPSLKKTGGEGGQATSVRRSASLRAPSNTSSVIRRTGSVRRKQGSEVQAGDIKKEAEKGKEDANIDESVKNGCINIKDTSESSEILTKSSNETQESSEAVVQKAEMKDTVREKVVATTQVKQEAKDSSQSKVVSQAQKMSKTTHARNESSKEGSKKTESAGSSTAKAIRPRGGAKAKEAPPAVAPKPSVPLEQEEGVVEESLSAGQAILKFESESAAFAAAASVESLCRNVQEKTVQEEEEQEEETSNAGEGTRDCCR